MREIIKTDKINSGLNFYDVLVYYFILMIKTMNYLFVALIFFFL